MPATLLLNFLLCVMVALALFVLNRLARQTRRLSRTLEGRRRLEKVLTRQAAATARAGTENRLGAIVDSSSDAIIGTTIGGTIIDWNSGAERIYGHSIRDVAGHDLSLLFPRDAEDEMNGLLRDVGGGERIQNHESEHVTRSGARIQVSMALSPIHNAEGDVAGIALITRDITQQRRIEKTLNQQAEQMIVHAQRMRDERRFRSLVQNSSDVISVVDRRFVVEYLSPSAEHVFGHVPDALIRHSLRDLVHPDDWESFVDAARSAFATPAGRGKAKFRLMHGDGTWRHTETSLANLLEDEDVRGLVLNTRDVTERQEAQEQLAHRALYDHLTGLPNRVLFLDRLEVALTRLRRREGDALGILFLDLDGFKTVNDGLGHDAGDRLLVEVATRLRSVLRGTDTAGRFGGDEFAILCEEITGVEHAQEIAGRVANAILEPIDLEGREIFVSTSVGIAVTSAHQGSAEDLLRDADAAMYRAKSRGRGRAEIFNEEIRRAVVDRLEAENAVRRGVEDRQFEVFFQPQVALRTGRIVGAEALARWNHPTRGLVGPADFIPIAEETGVIVPLGSQILELACRCARLWRERFPHLGDLKLSVNLSPRQLQHAEAVASVAQALTASGFDPQCLTLELTENVLMGDFDSNVEKLHQLRSLGVRLAIDDFGTGYSSLSYLRRFPIDELKIDKTFVDGVAKGPEDSGLARAIIKLARDLNLQTVAEGIEDGKQLKVLRRLGCDLGQGYLIARPLTPANMEQLLEEQGVSEPLNVPLPRGAA